MPEGPEAVSFATKLEHMVDEEKRVYREPEPEAYLVIFPRCFAEGTGEKGYSSISINQSMYDSAVEPDDSSYTVQCNSHDMASARRNECLYLVDPPLKKGPLVAAVRGKGLVIAAGHHAVTLNLGLQACCHVLPIDHYHAILERDRPGPNRDKRKAERLRSFEVPSNLVDPGSAERSSAPYINIFCAFVMKGHTFIVTDFARLVRMHVTSRTVPWSAHDMKVGSQAWNEVLWTPFPDGPDWVLETDDSFTRLDAWQAQVLQKQTKMAIVQAITSNSSLAFGGFGRHLANDFLFYAAIHPGLSCFSVCSDEATWQRLRTRILPYMRQWRDQKFISQCVLQENSRNSFTFDEVSNKNYLAIYTKVYYKESVRVYLELYNKYLRLGYFDASHVIGRPYRLDPSALSPILPHVEGWHPVKVLMVQIGNTELKAFTIIRARPVPQNNLREKGPAWSVCDGSAWSDIRTKGNATTLGPASFRELVQNRVQSDAAVLKFPRGRPPKNRTKKPG